MKVLGDNDSVMEVEVNKIGQWKPKGSSVEWRSIRDQSKISKGALTITKQYVKGRFQRNLLYKYLINYIIELAMYESINHYTNNVS